jgi:hypothetical protein
MLEEGLYVLLIYKKKMASYWHIKYVTEVYDHVSMFPLCTCKDKRDFTEKVEKMQGDFISDL